jgi:hypothetical protein
LSDDWKDGCWITDTSLKLDINVMGCIFYIAYMLELTDGWMVIIR